MMPKPDNPNSNYNNLTTSYFFFSIALRYFLLKGRPIRQIKNLIIKKIEININHIMSFVCKGKFNAK